LLSRPANLLRNADFRRCTSPGFPDYWATSAADTFSDARAILQLENETPLADVQAVRLSNPDPNYTLILESFNAACEICVREGGDYTFSVYLRSKTDSFPATIQINCAKKADISVGRQWQRYHVTCACPTQAGACQPALCAAVSLRAAGVLWVAAPQLERGSSPTPFSLALMDDYPMPAQPGSTQDEKQSLAAECLTLTVAMSFYTREQPVRLLVETHLGEPTQLSLLARSLDGRTWPLGEPTALDENDRRWVSVNIEALPPGRYTLVAQALARTGEVLSVQEDTLVKLVPSTHEVRISRVHRCLMDGAKPFPVFGIIIFDRGGAPPVRQFDDIASHGFNTLVFPVPAGDADKGSGLGLTRLRQGLDAAHRCGLKVIALLEHNNKQAFPELAESTRRRVEQLRDHPALLAWNLLDEPSHWWESQGRRERGQLRDLYGLIRQTDPHRPIYTNEAGWASPGGGYAPLETTDIGSADCYPIGRLNNGVKKIADLVSLINCDCLRARKPAAFCLQLCGGSWDIAREPTPVEERAMTYLAVIRGTRLLLYWTYKPMNPILWDSMRLLKAELSRLYTVVLDDAARWVTVGTCGGRVHYALWELRGTFFLIACNAGQQSVRVSVPVEMLAGRPLTQARPWYGEGRVDLATGKLRMSLAAYYRDIIELN
jgi:hypothetical protein